MGEQPTWHFPAESDEILALLFMTLETGTVVRIHPNGVNGGGPKEEFSITAPNPDRVYAQIRVCAERRRLLESWQYQDLIPTDG